MTSATVIAALQGHYGLTWRQLKTALHADPCDLDIGIAAALKDGKVTLSGGLYLLHPDWPREASARYIDRRIADLLAAAEPLPAPAPSERPILRLKARKRAV